MIEVHHLSKSWGPVTALDDVSFSVNDGEVFGLLGPNGAGKTTAMSTISGVLKPDAGRVLVDSRDIWVHPREVKASLGVVPQELALYEDLTARDNLSFWGSLYGLRGRTLRDRVAEVLSRVGLADRARDRVRTYSGGMKRRLNLCLGLLHAPRFLLLDEPTVGIDPQARLAILEIVREIAADGTTVLYTTHYMDEAESLCNRIAIIDHGRILASGTLAELRLRAGEAEVLRVSGTFDEATATRELGALPGLELVSAADGAAVLTVRSRGPGLLECLPAVLAAPVETTDVSIQKPSLESVFISLTGRELRD